uniref:Uncharacterized protein n=1 Tax=Arundo donax TaxID=35708 RepID=A0A0A8ZGQ9_ARUDO
MMSVLLLFSMRLTMSHYLHFLKFDHYDIIVFFNC